MTPDAPEPPATPAVRAREAEQAAYDALEMRLMALIEDTDERASVKYACNAAFDAVAASVTAELREKQVKEPTHMDELAASKAASDAYDRIYSVIGDCDAIQLDRYLAAYRQANRAELLASGTPLWVATDGGPNSDPLFRTSAVFQREPQQLSNGDWHDSGDYGLVLHGVPALTPPGTVHQAVLLMKPEEQA